ncbi:MAG: dihydroneopterin aldolase [Aeromicrobium sp.]|nr:MAG: dihydroneopterin aldolase [Aeromicrobium sp.]
MSCPEGLDRIDLTGLRVRGNHGVFDHERRDGQVFVIDVSLGLDLEIAAKSDNLADTVHYGELANTVHGIVSGEPVDLIETLVLRIVEACLSLDRVGWTSVTVHKPEAPIEVAFSDVAVTMERSKK